MAGLVSVALWLSYGYLPYDSHMAHVRLTVNLLIKVADTLKALHHRLGLSQTDIVNRAISCYDFMEQARLEGRDILLRDKESGEIERVTWF